MTDATDDKTKKKTLGKKVTKVEFNPDMEEPNSEGIVREGAVLNLTQRLRRRAIMRRSKAKIEMGERRALRRHAAGSTIKRRSRRVAIRLMRKKLLKNRNYQDLPLGARAQIDKIIARRRNAIARLSVRIEPRLRSSENRRKLGSKFATTQQMLRPSGSKSNRQVTMENYVDMVDEIMESVEKTTLQLVESRQRPSTLFQKVLKTL